MIILANSVGSQQNAVTDYWDDDWDDDSEIGQTQAYVPPNQQQASLPTSQSADYNNDSHQPLSVHSVIPERSIPNVPKKNNKFVLVKTGEDNYLLSTKKYVIDESEKIYIQEVESGRFSWVNTGESYNCVVTSPKKDSKFKGLKSFIVYQLTPTVSSFIFCLIYMCLNFFIYSFIFFTILLAVYIFYPYYK